MKKNLTMIITMAGQGSRFLKAGYACPKYMIEANGKTLFEWSMDSLLGYNAHVSKYIFLVRREHKAADFIYKMSNLYGIDNVEIVELDHLTDGQATTCMYAIPFCEPDNAIMVYNIDTYVEPYELKYEDIVGKGHIPCFHGKGDHWSFVKLDDKGQVIKVSEKVRISDNCTLGAYYFSSAKLYKRLYEECYGYGGSSGYEEKYIAPLYNYMIKKKLPVTISMVESTKVHVLGTPEELQDFMRLKRKIL